MHTIWPMYWYPSWSCLTAPRKCVQRSTSQSFTFPRLFSSLSSVFKQSCFFVLATLIFSTALSPPFPLDFHFFVTIVISIFLFLHLYSCFWSHLLCTYLHSRMSSYGISALFADSSFRLFYTLCVYSLIPTSPIRCV